MISEDSRALMRRITKPARVRPAGADDGRAWRVCAPRSAEAAVGLVLSVLSHSVREAFLDEVLAEWGAGSLAMLLRGPQDRVGIALADPGLVAAVIEVQITGRVSPVMPPQRGATDTDAALVSHLIDRWLADVAADQALPNDWHTARRLADPRMATLALEDCAYVQSKIGFDLGDGAKTGSLLLATPVVQPPDRPAAGGDPRLDVMADFRAILYRMDMPLGRLRGLAQGDVLGLPGAALASVSVETPEGNSVAAAQLGRMGAQRAIRIGAGGEPQALAAPASSDLPARDALPEVEVSFEASDELPDAVAPVAALPDLPPLEPDGG